MRDSADDVLGKILKNLQNKGLYCSEKPLRPVEDFVLKLRGCDVFFFGDRPMIDYHHIRDSIVFKHRIEIVVEPKKQAIERYVRFYTQDDCWNEMDHYRVINFLFSAISFIDLQTCIFF